MSTEEKKIIRKTTENVSPLFITPSTIMKAYDDPSIVLYTIGITTKVQGTVSTHDMLTHCGSETRKQLENHKNIQTNLYVWK